MEHLEAVYAIWQDPDQALGRVGCTMGDAADAMVARARRLVGKAEGAERDALRRLVDIYEEPGKWLDDPTASGEDVADAMAAVCDDVMRGLPLDPGPEDGDADEPEDEGGPRP
jgi:hypothetical protein